MGQKYAISQQPHAVYRIYRGEIEKTISRMRGDKRDPMSVLDVLMERDCGRFGYDFSRMTITTGDGMAYDPQTKSVKFIKNSEHIRQLGKHSLMPNPKLSAFALPKDSYGGINGLELKINEAIFLSEPNAINIKEGESRGQDWYEQGISELQRTVWEYLAEPSFVKPRNLKRFHLNRYLKNRGFRVVLPPLDLLFEVDNPVILPITITDGSGIGLPEDLVVGNHYFPKGFLAPDEPEMVGINRKSKTVQETRKKFEALKRIREI